MVAGFGILGCGLSSTNACTLDQKPSVSADGQLARLNPQAPVTQAQLATWSYFIFARSYAAGHRVTLTENRQDVARSLMPSALRQPWGWLFGDGTYAQGWTVRHAYAHGGHFRIQVYAYNPESHHWDLFDQVGIVVGR